MVAKKSKRGRKATRKTPPPLAKGGFAPEQIIDKIDLRETCNQVFNKNYFYCETIWMKLFRYFRQNSMNNSLIYSMYIAFI